MSTPSEKTEVVTKIVLVACVAKKANQAARAADLYQSQWFKFARAYAESTGCPWYILSAKHGFVYPSQILAPYEKQISGMSLGQQIMWAVNVYNRIKQTPSVYQGSPCVIEVLAGMDYRKYLVPLLRESEIQVSVPLANMGIGQQMAWMKAQVKP